MPASTVRELQRQLKPVSTLPRWCCHQARHSQDPHRDSSTCNKRSKANKRSTSTAVTTALPKQSHRNKKQNDSMFFRKWIPCHNSRRLWCAEKLHTGKLADTRQRHHETSHVYHRICTSQKTGCNSRYMRTGRIIQATRWTWSDNSPC